jgi:hypothetical protein
MTPFTVTLAPLVKTSFSPVEVRNMFPHHTVFKAPHCRPCLIAEVNILQVVCALTKLRAQNVYADNVLLGRWK